MKRKCLAILLLVGVTVLAQEEQRSAFDRWDKNGDGKLSREELPAFARQNFERVDTNRNGSISREEDAAFRRLAARSSRRGRLPENVEARLDVSYAATENPRQRLDVYLPKKRSSGKPLPVVAFIHGGGWRNGDKAGGRGRVLSYASSGEFVGVSIGYRLSGEAKWPAQIHDCKAAIRWLKGNSRKLNIDPNRIGVMGSSAGGHLVAILGTSGEVESLEGNLGNHQDQNSRVACVVDEYGPTNFLTMNNFPSRIDHNSKNSPESLLIGGPIQERKAECKRASPLTYISKDDAPFLIIHGTEDPLVPFDQSVVLQKKLITAGVPSVLQEMTNGEHGGFRSEELAKRTRLFFEHHLLGREHKIETGKISIPTRKR